MEYLKNTKILVGLGNPGSTYEFNRHNIGFILIDDVVDKLKISWDSNSKFNALTCRYKNIKQSESKDLIFVKPQGFMNNSGESVLRIADFYKINPSEILVIHDDIDLDLGRIKVQYGSTSAGHHGVESIINHLGTSDFGRIRVGVGRPKSGYDVIDYVLSDFSTEDIALIKMEFEKLNLLY